MEELKMFNLPKVKCRFNGFPRWFNDDGIFKNKYTSNIEKHK